MPIRRARNEIKQPLQDITDQFTALPDFLPTALPPLGLPTPKPRRRARAPGGTLAAKLRAARNPNVPSSLPPSSPPSTSSRLPWDEHEEQHEHGENAHPLQILTSDDPAEEGAPHFEFDLANTPEDRAFVADASGDWVQDDLMLDVANMSDPFGFFAVERQLRAERAAKPAAATRPISQHTASSPVVDTTVPYPTGRNDLLNPLTPHKRLDKCRTIATPSQSSDGFFSPNTSSLPSTPSPSKPTSSMTKGKIVLVEDDSDPPKDADEIMDAEPATAKTRTSRRLKKKLRSSGSPLTTTRNSHTPLAKLPPRRAALVSRLTEMPSAGDRGEALAPKKKRGIKKKPASSGKRVKGKNKEDANDLEVERQEKWERERQARLEYFRKLQDYQVEKENVYVI